ncbi:MAG: efflux RND transporter permease subunit [Candidatus Obscuribacterales bacterium]
MWIVQLALNRAHTIIAAAITIIIFGLISLHKMAIDIFPVINIPIVSVAWTYTGMSPYYMENIITSVTERALTSTVNGIKRMESISVSGIAVIKLYLNEGINVGEDVAMATSVGAALLRQMPRGINPPFVTASSATDVPVMQLGIQSDTLSEARLFDIANNLLRSQLATVQGTKIPFPYGGKYRQVMIDLDPKALYAYGLSADSIVNIIKAQNVLDPTGTAKIGSSEYIIQLNNIPTKIEELNNLPVKNYKGAVVFLRDVGQAHDGNQPQLNIVNINGKRAVLFNILKNADASTLTVVNNIKEQLPRLQGLVPPECKINILSDQSEFVRECVSEVAREALIAAGLTALMILALLGSWRSTLIVATSIPLAMLTAFIALAVTGQSINSMTLGGLALAVGMLVDDATVEIENVHRNLGMGKDIVTAILDGAQQVALPALVSTMSICIVFVPVFLLTEPSRSLFVPLGMAVAFAMMASYALSRTMVPLMSKRLLAHEHELKEANAHKQPRFFGKIHKFIDSNFENARQTYQGMLRWTLDRPTIGVALFLGFYSLSFCLLPFIGQDYFPAIDGGQIRLHVCAPPGTRIETTEQIFRKVENAVKETLPPGEVTGVIDNIGLPVSGINYALSDSQTISEADGEILLTLSEHRAHSTMYYQDRIREMLKKRFPDLNCYFQPADMVSQILNAGLPAPVDIKIIGMNRAKNYEQAVEIKRAVSRIRGAVDVTVHQVPNAPHFQWEVDRTKSIQMGVTQKDVSNSFLVNLSSSFQMFPNFWLNNKNRINYNLAVQTPQHLIASLDDLRFMSITPTSKRSQAVENPPVLTNVASFKRSVTPAVVNHVSVMPVYDVFVSCQSRDLGGVAEDLKNVLEPIKKKLPQGTLMVSAGQVMSMELAFMTLIAGLAFAILLVYLLLVVNFQSWSDPLIILMAVPGALSGIIWSLFVTQTTFTIPALMGAIMTIGVASANSILMVTFAREQLAEGFDSKTSAYNAGYERFRPVIMTATAMIIGMIPMSLGTGQGGSQNAPIGRAVIGGLMVATMSTLFFVPLIFSISRKKRKGRNSPDAPAPDSPPGGGAHVDR